jgi:hypothetical protein
MRRLVCLLIATFCVGSGCAGTPDGPSFAPLIEPRPDDAMVYVWRKDSLGGIGSVDLRLNGEKLGMMRNGEFLAFLLDPGEHTLRARLRWLELIPRSWNGVDFEAKPGQTLFLRVWAQYQETPSVAPTGTAPGRPEGKAKVAIFMAPWAPDDAMLELEKTRRAPGP